MQEVSRRMVAARALAATRVHLQLGFHADDDPARRHLAAMHHDAGCRLLRVFDDDARLTHLDDALVADLAAGFSVERGPLDDDLHRVTGLGFQFVRNTTNDTIRPTRGSRLELGIEQAGALGGDYDFTKLAVQYNTFLTLYESFLGYKTILKLSGEVAGAANKLANRRAQKAEEKVIGKALNKRLDEKYGRH